MSSNNPDENGGLNGHAKEATGSEQPNTTTSENAKDPTKSLLTRGKQLWAKTGITLHVYELLFKGALAPTIAISAYQSTAWAEQYTTIGYLVGIMTVLSLVIQPRAKFVQTMLVQILLTCLAAAVLTLASYCAVQARINSEGFSGPGTGGKGTSGLASKGAETTTYNSSASAVAGIWLFAVIYAISVVRAKLPQYTVPCIMVAIITNVAMAYAPQFGTMTQAEAFMKSILLAFLTGFAISIGVSLLVFPSTSRQLLFSDMSSFLSGMRSALGANMTYLNSLEATDMFAAMRTNTAGEKPLRSPEAQAFVATMSALAATQAKMATNLPFAKREVAIGKLGPDDLQQIAKLLREITLPIVGLSCMSDIFDRTSEERGWDRSKSFADATLDDASTPAEKGRIQAINEWHQLMKLLKVPFGSITDTIDEGLQHAAITLQLTKRQKGDSINDNEEVAGVTPRPGDKNFATYLRRRTEEFQQSKQTMLRAWCSVHGVELPDDFFTTPFVPNIEVPSWMNVQEKGEAHRRIRRQLMIVLYVEFLFYITGRRTLDLIEYVDGLRDSGKLSKNRLVVPGLKRLRKWFLSALRPQSVRDDDEDYSDPSNIHFGQAFQKKKDPEHLPPENTWENLGNTLRKIAHFFASPASVFGFRVACATMSIAIVNYLRHTQVFFTKERLFWAQIMTSIAMSPSAGQSLRTLVLRLFGTFIAMIVSFIAYYIVDGNTAGILVFFFIFLHAGMYIVVKSPTVAPIGIISMVTLTLILGYELQVRKIGIQLAQSNGQKYYPVYELGPIRLATVMAGLFVAWVFTVFPYPITEHSQLRRNLGSTLYLLANYYSAVHETTQLRLRGGEDLTLKNSPGSRLAKVRQKLYSQCNILLSGLRSQCGFIKFDIPIGGKFPRAQYQEIVTRLQNILNFMSLVSVASITFSNLNDSGDDGSKYEWVRNLRKVVNEANLTSQTVTTLLSLLSASMSNGQALPPYLRAPEPYLLSEKLERVDSDLLSVRHIAEPGYASFAVVQIGTTCLVEDLKQLLIEVKELVGELDFSYEVVSTADSSQNVSEETLTFSRRSKLD